MSRSKSIGHRSTRLCKHLGTKMVDRNLSQAQSVSTTWQLKFPTPSAFQQSRQVLDSPYHGLHLTPSRLSV